MKIIKGILIAFGLLFTAIVGIGGYAFLSARSSLPENQAAAVRFLEKFGRDWNAEPVSTLLTERCLADLRQAQRTGALRSLSRLGHFKVAGEATLVRFHKTTSKTVTVIQLPAQFEYGSTVVVIAIEDEGSGPRIAGFNIQTVGQTRPGSASL